MNAFHSISSWWKRFSRKRRLSMLNATDNVEEWYTHISPAGLLAAFLAFALLLFILILSIVAYTPEPEPEKPEFVDANMSMEELMKTEDPDRNYRLVSYRDDTCAMYSFFDPMTELQRGTPRDQLQWVSEKVDGNSVCWTYRITNGDHDEAVRQILERWAEKEDEEE